MESIDVTGVAAGLVTINITVLTVLTVCSSRTDVTSDAV